MPAPPTPQRLCVHWPRLGPLHLNRLRAAHAVLSRHGVELIALETASDSAVYEWRIDNDPTPYRRETVFPGELYDDIAPNRMHEAITATLDRLDPDAVHIHSYSTPDARACLAWCLRHGRTAICMAESKASDAERVWWREVLKRAFVTAFDAAQSSGSASSRYFEHLGIPSERIFAGYSVVDNDYFAERAAAVRSDPTEARTLPGLENPSPFFFASARFMERKDLPALFEAYARYHQRATDSGQTPWRLLLLGDGPLRPQLEELVRSEGLEHAVAMPGWRQIEDLPSYYALASAFVHTATVDQWGLVVNEAMAAGLPVLVSTGAGCAEDLVRNGENGFTFAPGDVDTLTDHLYAVAHELDRDALARRSRELICEWPLQRFGTSLYNALQAGLAAPPPPARGAAARTATSILRAVARSPRSFHSVQD